MNLPVFPLYFSNSPWWTKLVPRSNLISWVLKERWRYPILWGSSGRQIWIILVCWLIRIKYHVPGTGKHTEAGQCIKRMGSPAEYYWETYLITCDGAWWIMWEKDCVCVCVRARTRTRTRVRLGHFAVQSKFDRTLQTNNGKNKNHLKKKDGISTSRVRWAREECKKANNHINR